jgi:hypothetical protein
MRLLLPLALILGLPGCVSQPTEHEHAEPAMQPRMDEAERSYGLIRKAIEREVDGLTFDQTQEALTYQMRAQIAVRDMRDGIANNDPVLFERALGQLNVNIVELRRMAYEVSNDRK